MVFKKKNEGPGLINSVLMAYLVIILHFVLIAALGLLVIFFQGIINYMIWIFLIGTALIAVSAYIFYRRMKEEGRSLRETLSSPLFGGRTVEVSLLGGIASLKIGSPGNVPAVGNDSPINLRQLEDPVSMRIRELAELSRLLEKEMITLEEYNKVKQEIIKPNGQ